VQAVEEELKSRDFILKLLKENLHEAQTRMKHYVDQSRTFREFEVGDWVFLRLRPYHQMSVSLRHNLKLSPRYYGPFQVVQKIGSVAYKLDLPSSSRIYPIFHVSHLKRKLGDKVTPLPDLPVLTSEGPLAPEPEAVLDRRLKKKENRAGAEVLVQWKGTIEADATWEDLEELRKSFPDLMGKVF
jgi:ribosomal protein L21E